MTTYLAFFSGIGIVGSCLVLLAHGRIRQTTFSALYTIVLLGLLVFMWNVSDPPELFSDFSQAYYPAGHAIVHDVSKLYDRLPGCDNSAICGFVNIPIVALMFAPLSLLTLQHAQMAFTLLSLACVLISLHCLVALTAATGWRRWAIVALFATNGPFFYSFREGNLTHVALLFLVLTLVCIEQDEDVWAGVLVACAALIKLPLGLLGVYFVVRGRWRAVAGLTVTLVALVGASLLLAGWESHVTWYRESILPFSSKALAAFNVQSIDGFLLRLRVDASLYDWRPIAIDETLRLVRTVTVGVLVTMSGLALWARASTSGSKDRLHLDFSIVLCLALIISPISWTHYYLFLLIPFSLYIGGRLPVEQSASWSLGMVACMLSTSLPVLFLNPSSGSTLGKLLLSHYVIGALCLWGLLCLANRRVTRTHPCQSELDAGRITQYPESHKETPAPFTTHPSRVESPSRVTHIAQHSDQHSQRQSVLRSPFLSD